MISVGLDYGTTTSLLTVYSPSILTDRAIRIRQESAYRNGDVVIRSPKRLLNDLSHADKEKLANYISSCIRKMIGELKRREVDFSSISLAITVPNAFLDHQCTFLKQAVIDAFDKIHPGCLSEAMVSLIPEPIAAALFYAYGIWQRRFSIDTKYIVVSDIGGGTTDLAVVRVDLSSERLRFKVVCTVPEINLGGDDIDRSIADFLKRKNPVLSQVDDNDLLDACRFVKERLSKQDSVYQGILDKNGNPYTSVSGEELRLSFNRKELEDVLCHSNVRPSFREKYVSLLETLKNDFIDKLSASPADGGEGISPSQIDNVLSHQLVLLPVGGSSRIPLLRSILKDCFHRAPVFSLGTEDDSIGSNQVMFDSVARGAAIFAAKQAEVLTDFPRFFQIENRTIHRISIKYPTEKLFTCVDKNMPDGDHESYYHPNSNLFSADGKTFTLSLLEFYQGGTGLTVGESPLIKSIPIKEVLQTNGRSHNEIKITITCSIKKGELVSVRVLVPEGRGKGLDYDEVFAI